MNIIAKKIRYFTGIDTVNNRKTRQYSWINIQTHQVIRKASVLEMSIKYNLDKHRLSMCACISSTLIYKNWKVRSEVVGIH